MKRGFTLIELLVVIAIIALLIGILLPCLSTAKKTAQRVACATSLRSLQTGVTMYAYDNDEWLPSAEPRSREPISPLHWFMNEHLLEYLGISPVYDGEGSLVDPRDEQSVLTCPSHDNPTETRPRPGEPSVTHEYGLSYGMNGTFGLGGRPDQTEYRRLQEFPAPSRVCALADCWGTSLGPGIVFYQSCVRDNLVDRHLGRANVVFLDSHVDALHLERIPMGFANRYETFWSAKKP